MTSKSVPFLSVDAYTNRLPSAEKSPNRRNALESSNRTSSLVPSALNREKLSLSFPASSLDINKSLPLGVHLKKVMLSPNVSCVGKPPSVEIVHNCGTPLIAQIKASVFPSGESSASLAPCESKYLRTPAGREPASSRVGAIASGISSGYSQVFSSALATKRKFIVIKKRIAFIVVLPPYIKNPDQ